MEEKEDYWSYSEKKLIEHMHWKNMHTGSDQWIYLSNILNQKRIEKTAKSTKWLAIATWGLVVVTLLLVLANFVQYYSK